MDSILNNERNRVILMGRITQELEVRQTPAGASVLSFTGTYGSSVYDTEQMGKLIDAAISDCKALNISCEVDNYREEKDKNA